MKKINIFFFLVFLILSSSCSSYKDIPYYQDLNHDSPSQEQITNYSPLTIQPADILGINVNSRNPESSSVFNYNLNKVNGNNFDNSPDNPVTGYLVDKNGEIELPLIGVLKVAGLTTAQLKEKMRPLLLTYYKDATVSVRIINFKVTVYGDVQKPDVYTLRNEKTTITQALALAGDLNITAKRKNVILVREVEGVRNYIPIDLTSKKTFQSPYYYLRNNDEIYVQPSRTKYAPGDIGFRTLTLVLSGLSIIAITLSTVIR
ncbi:polysaccharide biosynthesis/export family protein [Pedobacter arcticus]|uniref:polysaccharide biosynthesis/export family protein n=1 Tax=Pedobacter arcticus TaxID=752140 RepID=UPI0002E6CAFD|nr:polysaccharide biosynthesis/export family protein [Pedobacter arcticus]